MSDANEYEVERINTAKVSKQGSRKIWLYHVKWKGYAYSDSTWEPTESFDGSEHFIDAFWARVKDPKGRDRTQLKLFEEGESLGPTGPPLRSKRKPEASSSAKPPKAQTKRTSSRDEIVEDSEGEVQEIVASTKTSTSTKKRSSSAVGGVIEAPSAKRPRGEHRQTHEVEPEPESISSRITKKRRVVSAPRAIASKLKSKSAETPKSRPSSSKLRRPSNGKVVSSASRPAPSTEYSPEETLIVPETLADESSSEAERAIVIESLDAEVPPTPIDDLFGDMEDVEMQAAPAPGPSAESLVPPVAQAPDIPEPPTSAVPPRAGPKVPAHRVRAANPRIKMMDDSVTDHSGLALKSNLARRMSTDAGPSVGPSKPRPVVLASRAGPGRSSGTFFGSTSLLTASKNGGLITVRKQVPVIPISPPPRRETTASPKAQLEPAQLEAGPSPTAAEMLRLAGMDKEVADALPDYEGVSDRDADGDSDHEGAHGDHNNQHVHEAARSGTAIVQNAVSDTAKAVEPHGNSDVGQQAEHNLPNGSQASPAPPVGEELLATTEPATVVPNPLLNPPNGIIGSGNGVHEPVAWPMPTIFGPLTIGFSQYVPRLMPVPAPVVAVSPSLLIVLDATADLPVSLKDIQPAKTPGFKPLDTIINNASRGPSGKFYGGNNASALVNALKAEGSCARVVLEGTATDQQKQNFERFSTLLKEGKVFLAMIGTHIFALCSSENVEISTKLGMSPNLIGLGDNILVAEVVIKDDNAYCDAAVSAEDERW